MSANSVLQRFSLAISLVHATYCQFCYRHTHTQFVPSVLPSMHTFFHPSLHLSLFYSRYALFIPLPSHPPPLSSSRLSYQSLSPSLNASSSSSTSPPLYSLCFLPPFPPADDTWCDRNWLRDLQKDETAGMCCNCGRVVKGGKEGMSKDNNIWESKKDYIGTCTVTQWHSWIQYAPNNSENHNIQHSGMLPSLCLITKHMNLTRGLCVSLCLCVLSAIVCARRVTEKENYVLSFLHIKY